MKICKIVSQITCEHYLNILQVTSVHYPMYNEQNQNLMKNELNQKWKENVSTPLSIQFKTMLLVLQVHKGTNTTTLYMAQLGCFLKSWRAT